MDKTRRNLIGGLAAAACLRATGAAHAAAKPNSTAVLHPRKPPPRIFRPDWSSLVEGYTAPDWFRDAKFGIWAHWGAPSVPGIGDDWYARNMYLQGHPSYEHHLKHYGHPADTGFMQIQNLWKAERWDPGRLLDLYRRAGARYFMALANHHDNFDCYASSHHNWNSTRIGPKKDIVGTWATHARERGLRFGVSNHSGHAWHWNQPAYGYDPEGARKGQRYDAARLRRADGVGTWWQGLDPQQLYTGPSMVMPDGIATIAEANAWHARTDGQWNEGVPPHGEFVHRWSLRCRELIDKYRPDLLYFDNHDLPLRQAGLDMAAYFYNRSMQWNGGRLDAVLTAKTIPPQRRKGLVDDVERGGKNDIEPYPWQTDTCLGNWFYGEQYAREDRYKTPAKVIHTLCDVVSKNGNLMLSVPLRGDGMIDDKEERILERIAAWMDRNGEAIYASRPWRVYGEGPTGADAHGDFSEGGPASPYGARDVRYVGKGGNVHALVLGWPDDGVARMTLLGAANPAGRGEVRRVTLAGDSTPLPFVRNGAALEVSLPEARRDGIGIALIVAGEGLEA